MTLAGTEPVAYMDTSRKEPNMKTATITQELEFLFKVIGEYVPSTCRTFMECKKCPRCLAFDAFHNVERALSEKELSQ